MAGAAGHCPVLDGAGRAHFPCGQSAYQALAVLGMVAARGAGPASRRRVSVGGLTRPAMMYRLAKIGFAQSYTYFTWRNTKYELTTYMNELNAAPQREFFRPNFFVNTPDINPWFLQTSGRAGFLIRAV